MHPCEQQFTFYSLKLIQQNIIPDLLGRTVLELGTGTGVVGLSCGKLGATDIFLTDYHEPDLTNVAINVQLNNSCATMSKLDFIQVVQNQELSWEDRKFDIVIASDRAL